MTIKSSGQLSMSEIGWDFSITTGTQKLYLSSSTWRTLAGKPTGAIKISDFYGKGAAESGAFIPGRRDAGRTRCLIVAPDPDNYGGLPISEGIPNITARETALGFAVDVVYSYAAFAALTDADLYKYMHIWDIGFYSAVSAAAQAQYIQYITQGGAVWWSGENNGFAVFSPKNNSIKDMITALGGGPLAISPFDWNGYVPTSVATEFRIAQPTGTSVAFNRPSVWSSYGTGTPMCTYTGGAYTGYEAYGFFANTAGEPTPSYPVVVWKFGSLTNAPLGTCSAIMDINWLDNANKNNNFIENLSLTLNRK